MGEAPKMLTLSGSRTRLTLPSAADTASTLGPHHATARLQLPLRSTLPPGSVTKGVSCTCLGFSPVPPRSPEGVKPVVLPLLALVLLPVLLLLWEAADRPAKPLAGSTRQFSVRESR
jgi:hypothetical protein